jgi:hypothetical protein
MVKRSSLDVFSLSINFGCVAGHPGAGEGRKGCSTYDGLCSGFGAARGGFVGKISLGMNNPLKTRLPAQNFDTDLLIGL